jgi:hypothetical protein
MPFVKRDSEGKIVAAFGEPLENGLEEVAADDPGLTGFLKEIHEDGGDWVESDLALARVLEDLIDVLINRGVIQFTDLPADAQRKLLDRTGFRREFAYVESLFGSEGGEDGGKFL